jgi:hypothetical protein
MLVRMSSLWVFNANFTGKMLGKNQRHAQNPNVQQQVMPHSARKALKKILAPKIASIRWYNLII